MEVNSQRHKQTKKSHPNITTIHTPLHHHFQQHKQKKQASPAVVVVMVKEHSALDTKKSGSLGGAAFVKSHNNEAPQFV
jgi:hypothetical protein